MTKQSKFVLAAVATLFVSTSAWCASVSLVGDATFSKPSFSPDSSSEYSSKGGYGAGLLIEGHLAPMFGLEIGGIYSPRSYEAKATNFDQKITQDMIEIPLVLRAHLGRFFSLGVGGYYGIYTGDVKVDNELTGVSGTSTYAANNLSKSDYGVVTSAALYFPIGVATKFLIDARYNIGLKNQNVTVGSTQTEKFNDLQLLAGFRFGF